MCPSLSAIAAPVAPLSGHHHRPHRHRPITHSSAPPRALPQTRRPPMSACQNRRSVRRHRCWPHRRPRCLRSAPPVPALAARLRRPLESVRASVLSVTVLSVTLAIRAISRTLSPRSRIACSARPHCTRCWPRRCAACSRSAWWRSDSHSSTEAARSRAEKKVGRSSTLALVRRASSSWDAAAASRSGRTTRRTRDHVGHRRRRRGAGRTRHRRAGVAGAAPQPGAAGHRRTRPDQRPARRGPDPARHRPRPRRRATGGCQPRPGQPQTQRNRCAGCPPHPRFSTPTRNGAPTCTRAHNWSPNWPRRSATPPAPGTRPAHPPGRGHR